MSELLWQGLLISAAGIGLTFAALGLIILTMILLDRTFPPQPPEPARVDLKEKQAASTLVREAEDEAVAAAIAVALAHFRSSDICRGSLGSTLATGPGAWWRMGRRPPQHFNGSKSSRRRI